MFIFLHWLIQLKTAVSIFDIANRIIGILKPHTSAPGQVSTSLGHFGT